MLVITRRPGETVTLRDRVSGAEIEITVIETDRQKARIGFTAPKDWIDIVRNDAVVRTPRAGA